MYLNKTGCLVSIPMAFVRNCSIFQYITVWVCLWMSVCLNVREVLDYMHGVCEWMEGHNENKVYIGTCN